MRVALCCTDLASWRWPTQGNDLATWPSPSKPIQSAQPKRQASIHEAGISKILQAHPTCQDLSGSVMTLSRLISRLTSRLNKADLGTCGQRPWWERRFDIPIIIKVRKRANPPKHPNQTAFCPTKRFIKLPANLWRNPKQLPFRTERKPTKRDCNGQQEESTKHTHTTCPNQHQDNSLN